MRTVFFDNGVTRLTRAGFALSALAMARGQDVSEWDEWASLSMQIATGAVTP
jgi:hypothetical protein